VAPRIADNLEQAGPRDLVHVDGTGRVRSRARTRVISIAYWGALAALVALEGYLGYLLLGTPGLSIGAVLGSYVGWVGSRVVLLRSGLGLLTRSKLDEADRLFDRVTRSPLTPRRLKARAWGGLAYAASLRGDPERALAHLRVRLRLQGRSERALALVARHSEVKLLARLGRTAEARQALAALPEEEPAGGYALLSHHTTHAYLAFCEGRHQLDDEQLHRMASFALGITSAAPLLALLAWAFEQNGDDEMRQLLLAEAKDRHPGDLLSKTMPGLQRWMDGVRVRVVDSEAEDEAELDDLPARSQRRSTAR